MAAPTFCSTGMVRATVSRPVKPARHQTALRGQATFPSEKATVAASGDASETSPCRRTGKARRSARPPKGNGFRQANSGGIETSVSRERLPSAASAQLWVRSVVGPHRWAKGPSWSSQAGHRREGQSNRPGSGLCRSATCAGLNVPRKNVRASRSPFFAPVRPCSSSRRAGGPQCVMVQFLLGRTYLASDIWLSLNLGPAGRWPCPRPDRGPAELPHEHTVKGP